MKGDCVIIDGSIGEGGGQILRTSLALAMVTGKPDGTPTKHTTTNIEIIQSFLPIRVCVEGLVRGACTMVVRRVG